MRSLIRNRIKEQPPQYVVAALFLLIAIFAPMSHEMSHEKIENRMVEHFELKQDTGIEPV